jgi:DMSO/TMAO reductase YedYZ heme-binding membrane subunit
MSDQFFWYVTRSAALVCWFSSAGAILVGLATSSRLLGRRPTIPWLVDLHRQLAAMTLVFLAIHLASLWLDEFVDLGVADLVVPWRATVPGLSGTSIALGVIAGWALVIVQITSLLKDRMPEDLWRSAHLLSFVALGAGTVHGLQTGSDIANPIVVTALLVALAAILVVAVARFLALRRQAAPGWNDDWTDDLSDDLSDEDVDDRSAVGGG